MVALYIRVYAPFKSLVILHGLFYNFYVCPHPHHGAVAHLCRLALVNEISTTGIICKTKMPKHKANPSTYIEVGFYIIFFFAAFSLL